MDQNRQNLEVHLGFSADTGKLTSGVQKAREEVGKLDRAAQEAQKSLDRMSKVDRAAARLGAGGHGGGTYGFAGEPVGQSRASAYMGMNAPLPNWQPGAMAPRPVTTPGSYHGPQPKKEAEGPFAEYMKAGFLIEALHKLTEAMAKLGESIDRSATMKAPGGAWLSEGQRSAYSYNSMVASLPGARSMAGALEWIGTSKTGAYLFPGLNAAMEAGGYSEGLGERAALAAHETELIRRKQPILFDAERQQDDLYRRSRSLGYQADAGARSSLIVGNNMPGYLADIELHPEVVAAKIGGVRARSNYDAAGREYQASLDDVVAARRAMELAQERDRATRFGPAQNGGAVAMAGLSGIAGHEAAAAFNRVGAANAEVVEREKQYQEALTRQAEKQVELARTKLELNKANAGLAQAELNEINAKIGQQKSGVTSFAQMDPWQQGSLLAIARKAQKEGFGTLDPDQAAALMPYLNDANREKLTDATFRNNPAFGELQDVLGQQNIDQLRRERDLKAEVVLKAQVDEGAVAAAAKKALDSILEDLVRIIQAQAQGKIKGIETDLQKQNAALAN